MTKKISILAIIFSGILSGNLYAETTNVKNTGTVGSETVNTQGHINKTSNVLNPNSYVDLSPFATVKAVNEESDINKVYGWNATPKGDIFAYTLTDNNGKTVNGVNCPDGKTKTVNGNSYCSATRQIEKDQPGNDGSCKAKDADGKEYSLTIPYGYKCENSYIIPDGYVKQEEEGSGAYKGYFYRYWISGTDAEKFCEPAFRSIGCWSPAYPIIAYNGFTGFNIPNTEAGAELAKKAFGTREPGDKDFDDTARENIKNAYVTNNDYRMGVKVTAVTETDSAGKDVPKGGYHTNSDANLTVQKWKIVSGKGLDPDFNYSELSSTGGNEINSIDNLSMTSKVEKGNILPCGMFKEVNSRPAGVSRNQGVTCSSGYVRVTQDKEENNSSPISYTLSGPLYTKYKIKLPTGNGTFESSSTHDLKVRACAKCESVANNCKEIIRNLVVQGDGQTKITDLCQLMEALRSSKTYNLYGGRGTYTTGSTGMSCSTNDCLGKLDDILLNDAEIRTALSVSGDCAKKLQN